MNNTPKKSYPEDNASLKDFVEDDAISAGSLDSNVSINSHHSSTLAIRNETDETVTIIETEAEIEPKTTSSQPSPEHETVDIGRLQQESIKLDDSTDSLKFREMSIGSIYDQFLIEYVVRLVCYKFLLAGHDQKLKLDSAVRVSIKNLSLIVLSDCVRIYPQVLLMKLTVSRRTSVSDDCRETLFEDLGELCLAETTERKSDEVLLDIIPDHFGMSTSSIDEFLSPLSDSSASSLKTSKVPAKSPNKVPVASRLTVKETQHDMESERLDQNIEDILLYFNHHDPSLRGNVQSIVGNFIVTVLEDHRNLHEFRERFFCNVENKFVSLNLLLNVLMQVRLRLVF